MSQIGTNFTPVSQRSIPRLQLSPVQGLALAWNRRAMADLANIAIEMLRAYPHFVVVKKPSLIEGRALIERLGLAIANTPPVKTTGRKPSYGRIEINPEIPAETRFALNDGRTNQAMALHTDESSHIEPHELVVFDFTRVDPQGDTLLAAVEDVVGALDDQARQVLEQPKFPFGRGIHPVLWEKNGMSNIRYKRTQLDKIRRGDDRLTSRELDAMEALDAVLRRESILFQFHAEAGETLFFHNTKVLHGRTGFSATSNRLIYRTRMHAGCLS